MLGSSFSPSSLIYSWFLFYTITDNVLKYKVAHVLNHLVIPLQLWDRVKLFASYPSLSLQLHLSRLASQYSIDQFIAPHSHKPLWGTWRQESLLLCIAFLTNSYSVFKIPYGFPVLCKVFSYNCPWKNFTSVSYWIFHAFYFSDLASISSINPLRADTTF